MQSEPLVSVVIPTFNYAHFVGEAVRSVLSQTYAPVEIIVVDDGSTDNTRETIAHFGERVRYVYQENRGLPGARNAGIREARGEFVAFLDSDDFWTSDAKLALQMAVFAERPALALVHCAANIWLTETDELLPENLCSGKAQGNCYEHLFRVNELNSSTVVARKSCLEAVGGFDESFRSCEDWDLWLRLARRYEFGHVPQHLVTYRIHGRSMARNRLRMCETRFRLIEKAVQADPTLHARLGKRVVAKYLGDLAFSAARVNVNEGDLTRGRAFVARALWYDPMDLRKLEMWASTYLTPTLRSRLARLKKRFARALIPTERQSA
jgi:glycosyltransferase involved in cell wall biosynthesis